MKENIIRNKSFRFALKVVALNVYLSGKREFVLSKQLLRSGTSVGAMVREAEQAESKPDFIHKLSIAQKEANETDYWLDVLFHSNYIDDTQYKELHRDLSEIKKIIASIIVTMKQKIGKL
ncbi:Four helix bundle protein [Flavobacterium longum]|uniref:four helix bundle protein n=1 Tax=Flavobacterium longum TaxID=1299340 RepID=UPI0039E7ECD9